MQSENFDKEIRSSLSQRPPGNDKPEWDKMEKLLDKHMPAEKKDRRRVIFILFLFLLLGGGAFFIWKNNGGNDNNISAAKPSAENPAQNDKGSNSVDNSTEKNSNKTATNSTDQPKNSSNKTSSTHENVQNIPSTSKGNTKTQSTSNGSLLPGQEVEINTTQGKIVRKKQTENKNLKPEGSLAKNIMPVKKTNDELAKNMEITKPSIDKTVTNPAGIKNDEEKNKEVEAVKPIEDNTKTEQNPVEKKIEDQKQKTEESQPKITANTKTQKQKSNNSVFNNLFFSVSAGPDLSIVKFDYAGKVKLSYGAGIGYAFGKNFTVQTGLYVGRKIYSANPEDYYIPEQYLYYYPKLKPIEADCKIYEVPLSIAYHFNPNKKQSWFVSAGSSSLFMKKEKYDYYYKSRYTYRDTSSTRILENQNKHYFSTLNISGGYERKISEHLTLQAEPYMKFALNGIGSGKVKLNSGGIFLTAVIKPFARKSAIKNSP